MENYNIESLSDSIMVYSITVFPSTVIYFESTVVFFFLKKNYIHINIP